MAALPTILAFVALWLVLDRGAAALGSFRGEAGIFLFALVLIAALTAEWILSRRAPLAALRALGLGAPRAKPFLLTLALSAAMLAFYPLFAQTTGAALTLRPDAALLILGLFAQAGLAEEAIFRGFLFRRLREGRSFWRAAWLSAIPFVAVHLLLFLTLDPALAAISILLALIISFPLAWAFERSGGIWAPALVHFIVQGSIKLVDAGADFQSLAIGWMIVSGLAPWTLFLLLREKPAQISR